MANKKRFNTSKLFLGVLIEEIPSILQIITLVAFFTLIAGVVKYEYLISGATSFLLITYLQRKLFISIKDQIKDPFSDLNRYEKQTGEDVFKPLLKKWNRLTIVISFVFSILVSLLTFLILHF